MSSHEFLFRDVLSTLNIIGPIYLVSVTVYQFATHDVMCIGSGGGGRAVIVRDKRSTLRSSI